MFFFLMKIIIIYNISSSQPAGDSHVGHPGTTFFARAIYCLQVTLVCLNLVWFHRLIRCFDKPLTMQMISEWNTLKWLGWMSRALWEYAGAFSDSAQQGYRMEVVQWPRDIKKDDNSNKKKEESS